MYGKLTTVPNIIAGWVAGVSYVLSPHYNRRPQEEISLLVIHNISLPPKVFGGNWVERFFTGMLPKDADPYFTTIYQMQVSSHFYIKRTGEVIQFVSCLDRAWHAGVSRFGNREACNDFALGIELEGTDNEPYSEAQYQSLVYLTKALMLAYPAITKERIVGHCDIAPTRKTDPGQAFAWDFYKQQLP